MQLKPTIIACALFPFFANATSLPPAAESAGSVRDAVIQDLKGQIEESMKSDPSLEINVDKVDYNVDSEVASFQGVEMISTSKNEPFRLVIDSIEATHSADALGENVNTIFVPKDGFLSIDGMHFDTKYLMSAEGLAAQGVSPSEIEEYEFILDYFNGDDDFISSNLNMKFKEMKDKRMMSATSLDIENVGEFKLQMEMSGVYGLHGKSVEDQNLPMLAMSTLGINTLSAEFATVDLNGALDVFAKSSNVSREQFVLGMQKEMKNLLKKDELTLSESYRLKLLLASYTAITEEKEIVMSFSSKNINMSTIMGVMGQSTVSDQEGYMKDVLAFDFNVAVK